VKTVLREDALLTHDNAQLSSATSLGNLPLIVLAAEQNVEHDPLWLPAQQEMARLSSNAKLVVVDGSSSLHPLGSAGIGAGDAIRARLSRPRDVEIGNSSHSGPISEDRAVR
jgi:hypothetical protein